MRLQRASTERSAAFCRSALGEELLDRIEVGRIGRQMKQSCAGSLNGFMHARLSMLKIYSGAVRFSRWLAYAGWSTAYASCDSCLPDC